MPDSPSPSTEPLASQVGTVDSGFNTGIRVLCVDDHAVLIEGLRSKFAIDGRIQIVGELHTAEGLLDEIDRSKPDLVLLDIEMPGPDIFEAAELMRRTHPALRFVFFSAFIRYRYLERAYKCGAWGYASKGDDLDDLVNGIKILARSKAGTFFMGATVQASLSTEPAPKLPTFAAGESKPTDVIQSLAPRKIEVLGLIGKGYSRLEIARELNLSVRTVDGHQADLLKSLGLATRAELMRFAIREGLSDV